MAGPPFRKEYFISVPTGAGNVNAGGRRKNTTDVFYRFCKRDILKENGLRQLELVVCRGRAVHKPAPKRNKTVDALLDPYLA